MTAQFAKDQVSFFAPASVSTAAPALYAPAGKGLASRLQAVAAWIAEALRRRAVINELSELTDRELADIGLARGEIGRVFDADFAATRALPQSLQA